MTGQPAVNSDHTVPGVGQVESIESLAYTSEETGFVRAFDGTDPLLGPYYEIKLELQFGGEAVKTDTIRAYLE